MNSTDALAAALRTALIEGDTDESNAKFVLAALPEGVHLFTVDSLAAALQAALGPMHPREWTPDNIAAAAIQAAKEADRENE